jgi:hypothetical protein
MLLSVRQRIEKGIIPRVDTVVNLYREVEDWYRLHVLL